jgi:hypothetical protein
MTQVYKGDISRNINPSDLDRYIAAGWKQNHQSAPKGKTILVEEPTILQPTIEAKTIVNPIIGDANDKENEDGSIDR